MSSTPPDDSQRKEKPRGSRLVGRIVDPAVDDGLALTGPGAPGAPSLAGEEEHPVKARLLARARLARGEGTEEDRSLVSKTGATSVVAREADPLRAEAAAAPTPVHQQIPRPQDSNEPVGAVTVIAPAGDEAGNSTVPEGLNSAMTAATNAGARESADQNAPLEEGAEPRTRPPGLTPPPGAVASELERIARGGSSLPPTRASLSPNMVALLSALIGLSAVGSIGIFVRPFDPGATTAATGPASTAPQESTTAPEALPTVAAPERKKVPGPWRIEQDKGKPGHRVLRGKIGKNAFLRAIQDAGLPKSEAYRAYSALKGLLDLDHCSSSDTFLALVRGGNKELVAFEYEKSKEEVYQAKADDAGRIAGQRLDLQIARNQIRRAFAFDGTSFEDSARRAGFDPGLTKVAEEAFRGHLSLRELKRGDRLRIIAQEITALGEFARYTGIEALELLREGQDPIRIYYYSHPAEGGYFDVNGKAPYEGGWRKPIPTAPITSKFNMKRMHPVLNKVMPHTGTDFGAAMGTPIGATAPGTVTFMGYAGPSGNLVKVSHDGGYESGYAHLSRFEAGLKVGDSVARLQTVGYCGSTGRSTGPHLHFTMKKDGVFIDPESLNLDGLRVLPPSHRATFTEVRSKYDPTLDAIILPPTLLSAPAPTPEALSPAKTGSQEPDEGVRTGDGDEGEESDNPMMQDEPSVPPAPAPSAPAPSPPTAAVAGGSARTATPAPAGAPATAVTPSAIFLTDEDLLRLQSQNDDGEVNP